MNHRRFERQVFRLRNAIERKGKRDVYKLLNAYTNEVISYLDYLSPKTLINDISTLLQDDSIKKWMIRYYSLSGRTFGNMYRNALKGNKGIEDDTWESYFEAEQARWAEMYGAEKVVSILDTTKADLKRILTSSMQEGLSVPDTVKLIRNKMKGINRGRATTIARTELISASNQSAISGLNSTGINYKKMWSTSGLQNVRETHLHAEADSVNGIPKDQAFSNGLMYPGDPSGSAAEVINCRCTLLFEAV